MAARESAWSHRPSLGRPGGLDADQIEARVAHSLRDQLSLLTTRERAFPVALTDHTIRPWCQPLRVALSTPGPAMRSTRPATLNRTSPWAAI
jgi:hypothetical protein